MSVFIGIKTLIVLSRSILEILERPIQLLRKVFGYEKMAYRYSKGYLDTLEQRPSDTEEITLRKYEIMDRFDTLSYFGHNSLVWTQIEVIQIFVGSQEGDLQCLSFTFYKIQICSWSKLALNRIKCSGPETKYNSDSMTGF